MNPSPVPASDLERAHAGLILRYDSERNAILRTLYGWLNLTLLLSFAWPALVVFFEAPLLNVANTPLDWFLLRIGAPATVLIVSARLWWASGVPGHVANPARVGDFRSLGPIWIQILAFIILLSLALSAVLLIDNPSHAAKVLLFGLVEAAAIQVVLPGYVKTSLETVGGDPSRVFWICVFLYGITFALRGGLAAAIRPDSIPSVVAGASVGGLIAGLILGFAFVYLRDRTASLLPGIVLQCLVVALVPTVVG